MAFIYWIRDKLIPVRCITVWSTISRWGQHQWSKLGLAWTTKVLVGRPQNVSCRSFWTDISYKFRLKVWILPIYSAHLLVRLCDLTSCSLDWQVEFSTSVMGKLCVPKLRIIWVFLLPPPKLSVTRSLEGGLLHPCLYSSVYAKNWTSLAHSGE